MLEFESYLRSQILQRLTTIKSQRTARPLGRVGTFVGIQFHNTAQSFGARAGLEWSVEFAELDTEGNDWITRICDGGLGQQLSRALRCAHLGTRVAEHTHKSVVDDLCDAATPAREDIPPRVRRTSDFGKRHEGFAEARLLLIMNCGMCQPKKGFV